MSPVKPIENKTISFNVRTFTGLLVSMCVLFSSILGGVIKVLLVLSEMNTAQQVFQQKSEGKENISDLRLTTLESGYSTLSTKLEVHTNTEKK